MEVESEIKKMIFLENGADFNEKIYVVEIQRTIVLKNLKIFLIKK